MEIKKRDGTFHLIKMNNERKQRDWEDLRYEIQRVSGIYNPLEFQKGVERIGRMSEEYETKYNEKFCIHINPCEDWDI